MHPLLVFGIPGALLLYMLVSKNKQAQANAAAQAAHPSLPYSPSSGGASGSGTPSLDQSPSAITANYLTHIDNAANNLNVVNTGTAIAQQTDDPAVHAQATQQVLQAWNDLGSPIDTLTVQKDLNVLGVSPALAEDGVMGPNTKAAIAHFQTQMLLPSTGVMDSNTANALRRAVVAVTSSGGSTS